MNFIFYHSKKALDAKDVIIAELTSANTLALAEANKKLLDATEAFNSNRLSFTPTNNRLAQAVTTPILISGEPQRQQFLSSPGPQSSLYQGVAGFGGMTNVERCLMDQKISNIQQSNQLNTQLTELQLHLRYVSRF